MDAGKQIGTAFCLAGLVLWPGPSIHGESASAPAAEFETPHPGHVFTFPKDDGAHPAFRIEWWYVTGHLFSGDRRFGFQATFFRLAGAKRPGAEDNPDFSTKEVYLAHMAVTDVGKGKFLHDERLNRAGWDAHAAEDTLDLTNGDWSLRLSSPQPARLSLHGAVRAEASFDLDLTAAKPLVVFGENGISKKGAEESAASYYLTFSRLKAKGRLVVGTESFSVDGEAWMDHEISSSQLGKDQVGWDWVCLQLKDEPRELMLYRMRRKDGSADPVSRLQWVTPEGKAVTEPFHWEPQSHWTSPASHARYPSQVKLTTRDPKDGSEVAYTLVPLVADQELTNSLGGGPYWEGACRVLNQQGRETGSAYLELTGYAKALSF